MKRKYDITQLDNDSIYVKLEWKGTWFNFEDYSDEFEMHEAIKQHFYGLYDDFDIEDTFINDVMNASGLVDGDTLEEAISNHFEVREFINNANIKDEDLINELLNDGYSFSEIEGMDALYICDGSLERDKTLEDIGYHYIHEGYLEIPEHLEIYIDYVKYGTDMSCEMNLFECDGKIYELSQ